MIQIIALRKFTDKNGKQKLKHKLLGTAKSVPDAFKDIDSVIASIPESQRWNVYYTALNCKDPEKNQRRLRVFESQSIVPFDVDNLDTERIEDYITLFFEFTSFCRERTGIVFSGNGLQFIVQLNEPFTSTGYFEEHRLFYKGICTEFNAALKKAGLPGDMDPSVWSPARILRLPETENRKEKKGVKQAKLLQPIIEPQDFDWHKLSGITEIDDEHQIADWNPKNEAQIDQKEIFKSCNFFQTVRDEPGQLREPAYYAAISILARMENGSERCHSLAQKIREAGSDSSVASFSHADVERKIEQALTASGPRTCKGIANLHKGCKECPFYRKISSPITLKGEEFIATEKTGFHFYDKNGRPHPRVGDLVKFLNKKYKYKTINQNGMIYIYEDNYYRLFSETELKAFAYRHFKPEPKKTLVGEFVSMAKGKNLVPIEFFTDQTDGFLNCNNGVLNLKTRDLHPHDDSMGFRYKLPYDYNAKATAPNFEKFINDIMNKDEQRVSLLQEFGGFALSGDAYKYHKFLMLSGGGRNGKGTFVHILKKLAGKDNVSDVPISKMGNENNKQLLEGKLFNFCDEVNFNDFKDIGELKKMTGEGTILVKMMWNQPYQIDARAKLIFACNELPNLSETNIAVRDRLLLVPFENEYTEAKGNVDYGLKAKMEEELPGILNFFLDGYERLELQGRFTKSNVVEMAVSNYLAQNNPVIGWMDETPELQVQPLNGKCTFVKTNDLFENFSEWWMGKGKDISLTHFSKLFTQAIESGRNRQANQRIEGRKMRGYFDLNLEQKTFQVEWSQAGLAKLKHASKCVKNQVERGNDVPVV